MHNLNVSSFFFTNNTGAPQGDTLGLMYFFPIIPVIESSTPFVQGHSYYMGPWKLEQH